MTNLQPGIWVQYNGSDLLFEKQVPEVAQSCFLSTEVHLKNQVFSLLALSAEGRIDLIIVIHCIPC